MERSVEAPAEDVPASHDGVELLPIVEYARAHRSERDALRLRVCPSDTEKFMSTDHGRS